MLEKGQNTSFVSFKEVNSLNPAKINTFPSLQISASFILYLGTMNS